jgi:hypothetical protein
VCTGRKIGLSQGLYWAKDRPVTRPVLDEGWPVTKVCIAKDRLVARSVLGKGSACNKASIGQRIGL